MHPLIATMTDVINLTDSLLLEAQNDDWDAFEENLQKRQGLLESITAAGAVESLASEGFGELAAQLINDIAAQNERLAALAATKQNELTHAMRQLAKGDKLKNTYNP